MTKLAIFSDDGCDVTVDGAKVWSARDQGQALPDLGSSLHELPITLSPGVHTVQIDYSNTVYNPPDPITGQPTDIDGCTLFVYGGAALSDPIVTVIGDDPGDPEIGQTLTCAVNGSVDHLPAGHNPANLRATWTWKMGTTVWTPFPSDNDIAPPPDTSTFNVPMNASDNSSSSATFSGTFQSDGYFLLPVTATVTYYDVSTGENLGPFPAAGPATGYVGDIQDDPSYDPSVDPSSFHASYVSHKAQVNASPMDSQKNYKQHVVSGLKVKLSSHLIKLGLYSANHSSETDSATVYPAFAAPNVTFSVTQGEASVTPTVVYKTDQNGTPILDGNGKKIPTGAVTLLITAIKATDSAPQNEALGGCSFDCYWQQSYERQGKFDRV